MYSIGDGLLGYNWRSGYLKSRVYTNRIDEFPAIPPSGRGVTIDGLLVKDGELPSAGDITMLSGKTLDFPTNNGILLLPDIRSAAPQSGEVRYDPATDTL